MTPSHIFQFDHSQKKINTEIELRFKVGLNHLVKSLDTVSSSEYGNNNIKLLGMLWEFEEMIYFFYTNEMVFHFNK